jgi:hypothetical protein
MPRKVFVAGEILTAADVNANLMDQAVQVFDDAADRTTQLPSPIEGMVTYLKDTDAIEKFNGSVFVPVGTILQVVTNTNQTSFSTTANTFQATGLSATITPSSTSSKVLVMVSNSIRNSGTAASCIITIFRGTTSDTNIGNGANGMAIVYNSASGSTFAPAHLSILDSPSTASAQVYTCAIRASVSGSQVNAQVENTLATMTLLEVAG